MSSLKKTGAASRQAVALQALDSLRQSAKAKGLDKLTMRDIDRIIQKVRKDKIKKAEAK